MSTKPVVVYGASGYTGRLICEYLRELNVPFVAAGRNKDLLQDVVGKIPGIETAEHDIVEVEHSVEALTELFAGAQVVCNTVGPFIKFGPEVVEACAAAGAHYLDTTGEQDWLMAAQDRFGTTFADKGLLLSPGIAQMYTTGEIAANIALETPGLDTLDILVLWKGFPTYASIQTIFTILKAEWFHLQENQYVKVDPLAKWDVVVPGQHELGLAVPWGGTCHPVWFKNDPRVANVKVAGGVMNRTVMEAVVATTAAVESDIKTLPRDQWDDALAKVADQWASGHAAAGEPAAEHLGRLGARDRPARPQARGHPRQQQLQADRADAGLGGDVAAAAAAAAGRVRLGLPGVRAPRAARRAAPVRPRARPGGDRAPMSLVAYLDKGASLGPDAPCLTMGERSLSYAEVQDLSRRVAGALARSGVRPGDSVAILSGNDPHVVRLRLRDRPRRGGVVPGQPAQRGGGEPRAARALRLHGAALPAGLRAAGRPRSATGCRCSRRSCAWASTRATRRWRSGCPGSIRPTTTSSRRTTSSMLVGTGGTTGRPKGVRLTGRNVETMSALTLMSYPFEGRPTVPRARAADPRRRGAVLPGDGAGRGDRRHAGAGPRRVPRADRAAPGHAHVPAADADLHAARRTRRWTRRTCRRCSASGTARRRSRPTGWRRRSPGSGR